MSENRGCRDGENEDAEEKEKIVAKEEAESLMIFLITAARRAGGREKGQEKKHDGRRVAGVEEASQETTLPCRVNPVFIQTGSPFYHLRSTSSSLRRRRRGFSHKKY